MTAQRTIERIRRITLAGALTIIALWLAIIIAMPIALWWNWQELQRFWAAFLGAWL